MTCDDKRPLVHALADGELDVIHAREIEAHIASCAGCASTYAEAMALKQKLAMPGLRLRAPADLAQRIAQTLPAAAPKEVARAQTARLAPVADLAPALFGEPRKSSTSSKFATSGKAWALRVQGALAGAGGAFALAACLAFFVMRGGSGGEIAANLVDGHLRSLTGEHLFDVQSTDQHTVKPWFAGKLAVTPPVPDLALKGFTLVGGRLDYVRGQAAAVVVYRRRTHVINLFVWPGTDPAPPSTELSGYFLRHWTKDGLTFWAVSDIAEPELAEFETAYQGAT
ncbi:Transmembrane transcriptional regulator (anti-sigma factor RsiW) [Rhizobiales bacterium GAS191]|nr:Transmembrane transcriptional regulator (anti-sigma factor RsiW) [Rhizobiales bacterium GAS191]